MNILFMSLANYQTLYLHDLYSDLLRQFIKHGDDIYVISPFEKDGNEKEKIIFEKRDTIIKIKIWSMQKTNIIEKGISMLTIDYLYLKTIKKYFSNIRFDLILYPTPPITLFKTIKYIKKRDVAKTYLLLKDIFPQNAVDIKMMSTKGIKGLLYKYFRKQEKKLYSISDYIGCMSQANVDYVIKHNPEVNPAKIEICPNSTDLIDMSCSEEDRKEIRIKYGIPQDKTVFIYGGNLGKPQDIPFIIKCLRKCQNIKDAYFLIIGAGTEFGKLKKFISEEKPQNVRLMQHLSKEDYDKIIGCFDVGLIFLDYRFTIPNFPSRLLSYMSAKLPVLACTDPNTDIGKIIIDGGFGWWCNSNNLKAFHESVKKAVKADLKTMGEKEYQYLIDNYNVEISYKTIIRHF